MAIRNFFVAMIALMLSVSALATSDYRDLNYEFYFKEGTTTTGRLYAKPKPKAVVFPGEITRTIQQYPLEPPLKFTISNLCTSFYDNPVGVSSEAVSDETLQADYLRVSSINGDFDGDGLKDAAVIFKCSNTKSRILLLTNLGRTVVPEGLYWPLIDEQDLSSEDALPGDVLHLYVEDRDKDGKDDIRVITTEGTRFIRGAGMDAVYNAIYARLVLGYPDTPSIGDGFIDPSDVLPKLVGATGGSHSVGVEGSASYTIPIATPAAAGGQQPNLSLAYNSNGGNGTLGFGWNLNGQSRIHRCGKTIKQDGVNTPVNFTSSDQLCMDGQRLILKSGTHGANGAEYRLENEVFIKVIAQGSTNGMPNWFDVKSPDGSSMRYGYNADSRIEANGENDEHVLEWAIDRVQDRWSNYRDYTYSENTDGGSYRLDKIEYGGNLTATTSHTNRVQFKYGSRSNGYLGHMLGSTLSNPYVLTQIEVYAGTTKLRFYAMKYEVAEHNHVIYLKGVTECSGKNECLYPTKFEWEEPGIDFQTPATSWLTEDGEDLYSGGIADNEHWADMNGDGRTDRVWKPSNKNDIWVALANGAGTGFNNPSKWLDDEVVPDSHVVYSQGGVREIFADANGDGLTDYLWQPDNADNRLYVALNTGSDLQAPTVWLRGSVSSPSLPHQTTLDLYYDVGASNGRHEAFVDLNGDGLVDKVWRPYGENDYYVAVNNGTSFYAPVLWYDANWDSVLSSSYEGKREYYVDVTGDGLPERVWIPKADSSNSSTKDIYVAVNTGSTFVAATLWMDGDALDIDALSEEPHWEGFTDLNGDGLADRYWMPDGLSPKAFYVALSTGIGFAAPTVWLQDYTSSGIDIYSKGGKSEYFMDVNDDGYVDRVWRPNDNEQRIYVALSTGSAFLEPSIWLTGTTAGKNVASANEAHETFADVNGDGLPDRVWIPSNATNDIYVSLNQAKPSSELMKITNGFGHETKFTYSPLTEGEVYNKYAGITVSYPLNNNFKPFIRDARRVVSKVETSNGIGGYTSTSYKYYGLRYDGINKTSLGFSSIRATNDVTGMYDRTWYNQGDVSPLAGHQTADDNQQGMIVRTQSRSGPVNTSADYILSDTLNTWDVDELTDGVVSGQKRYVRKLMTTDITKRDLADYILYKEENDYTYYDNYGSGEYGHMETQVTITKDPDDNTVKSTTIDNDYEHFTSSLWLIGLSGKITVTDDVTGYAHFDSYNPGALSRVSKWLYDSNGVLTSEQVWDGNEGTPQGVMLLETTYSIYDDFGHVLTTTVSGADFVTRSSSVDYDATGRFVESVTNALSQSAISTYYTAADEFSNGSYPGLVETTTDANGISTHYEYDSFGRVITTTAAYGTSSAVSSINILELCGSGCFVDHAYYNIRTQTDGAGDTVTYLDILGREVRKAAQGFGGQYIMVDYEYNNKGQNWRVSDPYFEYGTRVWNEVEYDLRDRVIGGTQADGREDSITYSGGYNSSNKATATITTVRDIGSSPHRNEIKIERKNVLGQVIEVEDNQRVSNVGKLVKYRYDSAGNLLQTTDHANHVVSLTYDAFGRKTAMSDPDKGNWSYAYNGLGELVRQTNARSEKTCMAYDQLGRLVKRVDSYGSTDSDARNACANPGGGAKVALWTYDSATDGVGKLASTSLSTGYGSNEYSESRSYDSLSRLSSVNKTIQNVAYSYSTTYDNYSRPDEITYPAVAGTALTVKHNYNSIGFLTDIRNAANDDLYYEVEAMNPRGQITIENFGNGAQTVRSYDASGRADGILTTHSSLAYTIQDIDVDFDLVGNITHRADDSQGFEETFTYDSINRLIAADADFGNSDVRALDMTYDALGNILTKEETGANAHDFTYTYGLPTSTPCSNGSTKPHAVCAISGSKTATYAYDANGNMTAGDGRTITYATFDLPTTIIKGNSTDNFTSHISYGPDRNRYWRQDVTKVNDSVTATTTTVQVDGLYEKITKPNSDVEEKHYLGNFAVVTITNRTSSSAGTTSTRYLHQDHLGSLTAITDESGNLVELHNYDSWGKRRGLNATTITALLGSTLWGNLSASNLQLVSSATTRGYTGHEMFDDVGIVHMNGRIYDPEIGRFLQADPIVQNTSDLQAFNRYAYVQNNPLSLTDPSGYFSLSDVVDSVVDVFKSIVKVTVAIALAPFAAQLYISRQMFRETGRLFIRVPELQIVASAVLAALQQYYALAYFNAAASSAVTYQSGGSFGDVLSSAAIAFATSAVSSGLGGDGFWAKGLAGIEGAKGFAASILFSGAVSKAQGGKLFDARSFAKGLALGAVIKGVMDSEKFKSWLTEGEVVGDMVEVPDPLNPDQTILVHRDYANEINQAKAQGIDMSNSEALSLYRADSTCVATCVGKALALGELGTKALEFGIKEGSQILIDQGQIALGRAADLLKVALKPASAVYGLATVNNVVLACQADCPKNQPGQ